MASSRASTPTTTYNRLPAIPTTDADREFLKDVNSFIERELNKINSSEEELRYLVYKAAFNKVIDYVSAYKPLLSQIKKEYEDTIDAIKKEHQEASFLQGKVTAIASEPSTLRNYNKRVDELEERIIIIKKENEKLQQELKAMQELKEEREKRPKTAEPPKRQLKKDRRFIPGLTIEESTNINILQKKYEALDRQLKEVNISLRTRFVPKAQKLQLKETLDKKVAYRDQLLWQSQVYKARSQKLKVALEAAQAYNLMKPPHQTVGDAVILAFHQASGRFQTDTGEKLEGDQSDALQASVDDDDPNKEKEAEIMLEYIEKFNELFEDGLFEEAAVHAANSPKGILRTQATLAKFRDVSVKLKGRSPLLAFCDALMSTVKAAGRKPNEALSVDCIRAGLKENRIDLVYHWIAQDRLTLSQELGELITDHCTCPSPCKCGCQALAQNVFVHLKSHEAAVRVMLKQGKVEAALQYAKVYSCLTQENIGGYLQVNSCQNFLQGLLEADGEQKKSVLNITVGRLIQCLVELNKSDQAAILIHAMITQPRNKLKSNLLPLQTAITLDKTTSQNQWSAIIKSLDASGHSEVALQLQATIMVIQAIHQAVKIVQEDSRKGVSFMLDIQTKSDSEDGRYSDESGDSDYDQPSSRLSSHLRDSASCDPSSREVSQDIMVTDKTPRESILKKRLIENVSFSPRKSPRESILKKKTPDFAVTGSVSPGKSPTAKKGVRLGGLHSPPPKVNISEGEELVSPRKPTGSSMIRFMDSDPYTSNPESAAESEAE